MILFSYLDTLNSDQIPEIQVYAIGEVYIHELLGRPQDRTILRQDHRNRWGYSKRREGPREILL